MSAIPQSHGVATAGEMANGVPSDRAALPVKREVERAVVTYLDLAGGDPRLALRLAVSDGMGVARCVSRGFVRQAGPRASAR